MTFPANLLSALPTPAVILDRRRLQANCDRMAQRAARAGVNLRPHLKTAKSAEVARIATSGQFGVTEIRPGVYVFFDLSQARLGVCRVEDIAVSVLTTVIGHHREAGHLLVDAGALALSKDISANEYDPQIGYGLVCDIDGRPVDGLHVAGVHQEHGFVRSASGMPPFERFPIGSQLRILPNHACMTVAPYREYHVLDTAAGTLSQWSKNNGW